MRGLGIGLVFGALLLVAAFEARGEEGVAPPPRVTVRGAQGLLTTLGYRLGRVDGKKGPRTVRALRRFQLSEELVATGRLDRATRSVLGELLAVASAPPSSGVARALQATDDLLDREDCEGDDRPVDALVAATEVGDARDRVDAVDVLAHLHSPRARATLGIVLHGNDLPAARREAAWALARLADPVSLYTLALSYDEETDREVSRTIQEGLDRALPMELPPRGSALPASSLAAR